MTQSSQCPDEDLLFEKRGPVLHVTLNRPSALNALNLSMVRDLTTKLKECIQDPGTSVVTLRGAGEKAFCSGGDLKLLTFSARDGKNYGQHFFYEEFNLNHIIGTFPKPLVSILNGITFGGAAGLTVIGRFCVATERAVFCMPECAIGLFPDVGSGHFLSRLPNNMGMFLGLTGHRLKGSDIVRAGLASHYIDYYKIPQLDSVLESLQPPIAVHEVDALLNDFQSKSTSSPGRFALEQHMEQIASCFQGDSVEEIVTHLQQDASEWAHNQLGAMKKMSPTSLKITFQLLKEGYNKSLADTLNTEYRLTQRCVQDKDFHEGIRATILDKDGKPSWCPASLEEVTADRVNYYFSPLSQGQELNLK
jgi:3-hydroxyisobutyryl-CoA hydrolase